MLHQKIWQQESLWPRLFQRPEKSNADIMKAGTWRFFSEDSCRSPESWRWSTQMEAMLTACLTSLKAVRWGYDPGGRKTKAQTPHSLWRRYPPKGIIGWGQRESSGSSPFFRSIIAYALNARSKNDGCLDRAGISHMCLYHPSCILRAFSDLGLACYALDILAGIHAQLETGFSRQELSQNFIQQWLQAQSYQVYNEGALCGSNLQRQHINDLGNLVN